MKKTFYYVKEQTEKRLGTCHDVEWLAKKIKTIYGLKEKSPKRFDEKVFEIYSKKMGEEPVLIAKIFNKNHVEIFDELFTIIY